MKKILLLSLLLFITHYSVMAQITCTVQGRTINRSQSVSMTLCRSYEDSRVTSRTIQIKDSVFSFTIEGTHPECYNLIFDDEQSKGSWNAVKFCTTQGVVQMELYPQDECLKNRVVGGVENRELQAFDAYAYKLYDSLYKPTYEPLSKIEWNDRMSKQAKELTDSLQTAQGEVRDRLYRRRDKMKELGTFNIEQVNAINRALDSVMLVIITLQDEYEKSHLSIGSYSRLVDNLAYFKSFEKRYMGKVTALEYLTAKYALYAKAYPKHPYTKICADMLSSASQIVVGGRYIDFTAPDLEGNMVRLSDQITDKIALIDLWASWCAPCRSGSMSFKPIYEQYKDRGFTIVGIARENRDDKAMRNAISKDGYPWLNLLELNDRALIWLTYGINNGAGLVLMVDRDGTILAINPKAEQVQKILEEKLP